MTDVDVIRGKNIKVGDTLPKLRVQLVESGNPFNLSNYTVSMSMKKANDDENVIDDNTSNVTVEDSGRAIVSFKWEENHTSTRGTYLLEFVATKNSGSDTITFPNKGYETVFIEERL